MLSKILNYVSEHGQLTFKSELSSGCKCGKCYEYVVYKTEWSDNFEKKYDLPIASGESISELEKSLEEFFRKENS